MSATNIGGVVSSMNALVTAVNSGAPVRIGTLPAGAVIRQITIDTSTAFNGASGSISVGVSGAALNGLVSSGSVSASGRVTGAWNTAWNTQSATFDSSVYATYSGSASTSGSARVSVDYVSQSVL